MFGASGFIGRWVVRALYSQHAEVHLVVRDRAAASEFFRPCETRGQILECDLEAVDSLVPLFETVRPSITFNLAVYGVDHGERDERVACEINAKLVGKLTAGLARVRAQRWPGQDLVHVGSVYEYGDIGGDLAEDSVPKPITSYGKSKLAGTQAVVSDCAAYGLRGVVARLFSVYGPGEQGGRLLSSLLDAARTGAPVPLTSGRARRDFAYVEEIAEGLLRVGLAPIEPGQVVNIATGRMTTVRVFAKTAARMLQLPPDALQFGALPDRPEELHHRPVALHRLRRYLGWTPTMGLAEGIRRTIERVKRDRSNPPS